MITQPNDATGTLGSALAGEFSGKKFFLEYGGHLEEDDLVYANGAWCRMTLYDTSDDGGTLNVLSASGVLTGMAWDGRQGPVMMVHRPRLHG